MQYLACVAFLILSMTAFQFGEIFSEAFITADSSSGSQYGYILVFMVVMNALKELLKITGFIIDMGKRGMSMPYLFASEIVILSNYYVFYRGLFDRIHTPWIFTVLLIFHLAIEWMTYALRCTRWYYDGKLFSSALSLQAALLPPPA